MAAILIPSIWYSSQVNSATNCGPQSEITLRGMPWSFQTCWTNSLAVPAADRVVNVGTKWARLVKESVRATADGGAELAGDPKLNIFTE